MIRLFVNALGGSAGGGLTYIRNVLPRLAARSDVLTTVLLSGTLADEIEESPQVSVLRVVPPATSAGRFWYEQRNLPGLIRRAGADVLLCTGNFALYRPPVPQILLSRNALYTSTDFVRDLRERRDYRMWLDTEVKKSIARWSVLAADCTVAPSATFAAELRQWTGKDVVSIHHGFDSKVFFGCQTPLPQELQAKLARAAGSVRLLFVSHFNYYRNFEALIRATEILKRKMYPRTVRLILTCHLDSNRNPGNYDAKAAAEMVRQLGLSDEVIQLGAVPYRSLHHLYRACDFYVTPAYAETFAHTLVEAMASGLPVIASDLPVHKEICGEAARYFQRFSPEDLAATVITAAQSTKQSTAMQQMGLLRSRDFSWDKHVDQLVQLGRSLVEK